MDTPRVTVRIPPELEEAARRNQPDLEDVDLSTLIRVALLALAGVAVADAIGKAIGKSGPKPR